MKLRFLGSLCIGAIALYAVPCQAQLNGTYSIDAGGGGDYLTFTQAVNALTTIGVNGPVVFNVASGTYTEQVTIPDIVGTSATNTITFRSLALDSAVVVLTWPSSAAATNDYTVQLNGVDHITFDRITIARSGSNDYANVIDYAAVSNAPGSQFTRITHCRLQGTDASYPSNGTLIGTTTNAINDSARIDHCRLERGGFGVNWNNFSLGEKLLVESNVFVDQAYSGARLTISAAGFTFRDNTIMGSVPGARGLDVAGCPSSFSVYNNRLRTQGDALLISSSGNFGQPHIFNNMLISAAGSGAVISGSSTNIWFDHNSIQSAVYGAHFGFGANSIASFRNNAIRSGDYTIYRQTTTTFLLLAGRCALKRTTAGPLAFWGGAQNTLASLQSASGNFASSVVVDPLYFTPTTDLHVYAMELDNVGTPITFVSTDIDGDPRNLTTPDIGADEFLPQLWNEALNTCAAADPILSTGTGQDQWIYKDRKVVARFNDNGQNLGAVNMNVYVSNAAVRQSLIGQYYMDRNWQLVTQNPIGSPVSVRLFFSGSEFSTYAAADPVVTTPNDAGVAHYVGTNENCVLLDNPAGNVWTPIYPAPNGTEPRIAANGGTSWYTAVVSNDGELYITTMGLPLPIELIAFTGERINERDVQLHWTTASEHNNAGFEVWRRIDGEVVFKEVGWVDGAGNTSEVLHYAQEDHNPTERVSYYRLKQMDVDGRSEWSPMIAVEGMKPHPSITLFPNPSHDSVALQNVGEDCEVRVFNSQGKLAQLHSGVRAFSVAGLAPGVYALEVLSSQGRSAVVRLVVE